MKDDKLDDTQPLPIQGPGPAGGATRRERPYASRAKIEAAGLSHPGNERAANEDHFLVARMGRSLRTVSTSIPSSEVPRRFDETGYVMMVADGMGGAAAGEVASRTAIATLVNIVLDVPDWIMTADDQSVGKLMRRAVRYYRKVDTELAERARTDPGLSGMGTTMTVGYAVGTSLFIAHVGDSRAYLYRDGDLQQLTRDHTHVQELVDSGVITREQAATHHLRNVLTNVIGGNAPNVGVEIHRLKLHDGDRLLFCTDGLTEVVRDPEIAAVLGRSQAPEFVCRALVDLALERGGPDNVTVVSGGCTFATTPEDETA